MNLKKLQKIIEDIGKHLLPKDDWMPALLLEGKESISVFGFAWNCLEDQDSKNMVAEQLTKLITEFKPDSACFITTAWSVEGGLSDRDLELYKSGAMKLVDHPRRIEIISAYCYGERGPNEGEAVMLGYIKRFPDKGPQIKKWKILEEEGMSAVGRFPEAIQDGFKQARKKQ